MPFIQENVSLLIDGGISPEDFRPDEISNSGENKLDLEILPSHQVQGMLVFI